MLIFPTFMESYLTMLTMLLCVLLKINQKYRIFIDFELEKKKKS
jgi:hypothetical protein